MIEGLKPYAEYEESGLPWLGCVPSHWVTKRGKSYMTAIDHRSKAGKEELLTVSSARGVIPRNTAKVTMFKAESYAGYKLCWPGDLVINSLWAWGGGLGVSQHHGIISTAYSVYRPRPSAQMNPRFLHELVRSSSFNWELHVRSKGIWISRLQLTDTSFLDAPIPLPPPDEQAAIVRFLDHANRKIDGFTRAKRKLIGLLNEQRQAIIHRAVTQTFCEFLPLSILRLPKEAKGHPGWNSYSVGHLIQRGWLEVQDGNHGELHPKSSDYVVKGIPFLMANNVRTEGLDFVGCAKIPEALARRLRIGFAKPNDVLLTHKATIGQVSVVPENLAFPFVMLTPQVTYYRIRTACLRSDYLFLYMQSPQFQEQLKVLSLNQSTRHYVGLLEQRNLVICFPDVSQQGTFVETIGRAVHPIREAIQRAEREIALMQEYRTRLTADIVTGKLDVREAAAKLADLPSETAAEPTADEPTMGPGEVGEQIGIA